MAETTIRQPQVKDLNRILLLDYGCTEIAPQPSLLKLQQEHLNLFAATIHTG